ncbi:hypothetical protein JXI42_08290 [bacterium]|nr:hypothetical protein [bacterium]
MVLLPTILLWQLSCRKYEISENSIYIKYPVFHKKIDTSLIKEIIEKPGLAEVELKSAFNTRGFMGYIGFYKDKEHGLVSLHCNSLEGLLLLRVGEKKYLINPHNKLSFLEAMRPHRIASKDQTK